MAEDNMSRYLARRASCMDASTIREICKLSEIRNLISLAGGWPNPQTFPYDFTRKAIGRLMKERVGEVLQYGMSEGLPAMKEWLSGWLKEKEGITASLDEIVITAGAQMGMDLTCRVVVDPGEVCLVDLPTYFGGVGSMQFYGGEIVGVPTDSGGTRVEEMGRILEGLKREGKRVKLFYLQTLHHNPLGVNLAEDRKEALLALAREYDFLIMEDNPYGDLCYEGDRALPVKSMDREGRVVYIKSFSKIFSPGIRMAAVVAEASLAAKMVIARQFIDCCPSNLNQYLLYEFCSSGMIEKQIAKLRKFYALRRDRMLLCIEKYFPKGVSYTRPRGGLFFFIYLPDGIDASRILEEAIAENVVFVPGKQFFVDGSGTNTMRLSFAQVEDEKMEEAISKIGAVLHRHLG